MKALRVLVLIFAAVFLVAAAAWYWALHTNSGARWALGLAGESAGVTAGSIDGDLGSGLELSNFRLVSDSVHVSADSVALVVDVDLFPLAVDIVSFAANDVDVELLSSESGASEPVDPADILQGLVLPFRLQISAFEARDVSVKTGEVEQSIDAVSLVAQWQETIDIERLAVRGDEADLLLDATIDLRSDNAIAASISGALKPALTKLASNLDIAIDLRGYPHTADITARAGSFATLTGKADWSDTLAAEADVVLTGWDLATFTAGWPAGFPVSGTVSAALADERITISESTLRIDGTQAQVLVDAEHALASEVVSGHLRWQNLRWPLPQDEVRVRSESGDIRLAGKISDWTVAGNIAVATDEFPQGSFVIDAAGSEEQVSGRILDSEILGGRVSGQAEYAFTGERAWSADLDVVDLQLDDLLPDWPGQVSGKVSGDGSTTPFVLHATLADVQGEIRGMELRANGAVDIAENNVVARDVRIEHGKSLVVLDGTPYDSQGLNFEASIDDLGAYVEEAAGRIEASGQLLLGDIRQTLIAQVASPTLQYGESLLKDIAIGLDATDSRQSLQLSGEYHGIPFAVEAAGAFDDWLRPHETGFAGAVEVLEIDFSEEHQMRLASSAPLEFSMQNAALRDFCIVNETRLSLCGSFDWQQDGSFTTDLRLDQLPVGIVGRFVDTGLAFDQYVTGTLSWHQGPSAGTGGTGAITITPGTISRVDDPDSAVTTGEGKLDFEILQGRLLNGELLLPLPGRGDISGKFAVLDVTRGTDSKITGEANVVLSHIRDFSRLIPMLDSARGSLRASASVAGTVGDPEIVGDLELHDGRLVYLPIGLELSEVNLTASMDDDLRFDLFGDFKAGEGRAEIMSRADYSSADEPGLDFKLRGENLTLVNVPDVMVKIDPNIEVTLDRDTLTINGEVAVPAALIKPTNLATPRVNESEDVVIVAGELPDPPDKEDANGDFNYAGELAVRLGKKVVIEVDVAEAFVSGSTVFSWQGDKMPMANGRYNITGNIEAFGQVLEITRGIVNFPNVPADEPNVRINAEREIFGNTQIKRAGVLVDGPVKRPTIEAYTAPLTNEERALTLLVTGSDFDYEQGVGAIDFGTYIAPRLFVSYGVGVFERENVISARYDIGKGFGIKATSGATDSGVDLNYRFEN